MTGQSTNPARTSPDRPPAAGHGCTDAPVDCPDAALAAALHEFAAFDHITVVYRPEVDLLSGRIIGAEAFARWDAPSTGPVEPDRFLAVAEAIGAIGAVSEDVITRALADTRDRFLQLDPTFRISIALSPAQVRAPRFVERVRSIVDRSQVDPCRVGFVVDGRAIDDDLVVLAELGRLRGTGATLEFDAVEPGPGVDVQPPLPVEALVAHLDAQRR